MQLKWTARAGEIKTIAFWQCQKSDRSINNICALKGLISDRNRF